MIQRGDCVRLALETLTEMFPGHLDRDLAAQPSIERFVHLAHAAGTQD